MRANLIANNTTLYGPDLDNVVANAAQEYELNIKGVQEAFKGFIYQIDGDGVKEDVLNKIANMLKLKMRSNAPRRPPRILILGPPGSGRSS